MPTLEFWFTGSALFVLISAILAAISVIFGFVDKRKHPLVLIISILAIILIPWSWYQAALQAEESSKQDKQIEKIANDLGIPSGSDLLKEISIMIEQKFGDRKFTKEQEDKIISRIKPFASYAKDVLIQTVSVTAESKKFSTQLRNILKNADWNANIEDENIITGGASSANFRISYKNKSNPAVISLVKALIDIQVFRFELQPEENTELDTEIVITVYPKP